MVRRKASWVKTNVPWNIKIVIWQQWAQGNTITETARFFELHTEDYKGAPFDRNTISKVWDELSCLPIGQLIKLVNESPELKDFVIDLRSDSRERLEQAPESEVKEKQVPKNNAGVQPDLRKESGYNLDKHYEDLAKAAETLANNIAGIISFAEFLEESTPFDRSDIGLSGNVIIGGYYGMQEANGNVNPWDDEELCKLQPVNSFDAECLLKHLNYRFADLAHFQDWHEANAHNITREVVNTLYILARSKNFGVSPTCPVCKDIRA
jgi:hypothetical protein